MSGGNREMAYRLRRTALLGCDGHLGPTIDFFCPRRSAMEVSIGNGFATSSASSADNKHSPKSPKVVNFEESEEHLEGRKKYLTAKYGSHQMALIRKRLGVETWLIDALAKLYRESHSAKELDLDELLDMDEDDTRRRYLLNFLVDCEAPVPDIEKFVEDLLAQTQKL